MFNRENYQSNAEEGLRMDGVREIIITVGDKYIASEKGLATLLVILAITLKLLINHKVTKLHFKKMLVSVPSEITFLVMGFLLSAMIAETYTKGTKKIVAAIVIALIFLAIQYALEQHLDDKLSGEFSVKIWICVIIMYAMSVVMYHMVVFGGAY